MNYTELEQYVATQVSDRRLAHCRSTARQTVSLLSQFYPGCPEDTGTVIGLWHDVARQWSDESLLQYSQRHQLPMEPEERSCPMLLHGAVAAHLLSGALGEKHPDWELAIRWHTIGSCSMGAIGAALYIADYLEPLRTHLSTDERKTILSLPSMETMCLHIIGSHRTHLEHKGKTMAGSTEALERFLLSGGTFTA